MPRYAGLPEQGVKGLLAAVQHLTRLQHLELHYCRLHKVQAQPDQEPSGYQCFSALTASTQLTSLSLTDSNIPARLEHMFPPERVLPHLNDMSLTGTCYPLHWLEAAHIAMIAASCPALQRLALNNVAPWDFDVSCLLQLPLGVTEVWGLGWTRPA